MGVIQKNAFKIVYVAPMKALAAEMVENFGKRLAQPHFAQSLGADRLFLRSSLCSLDACIQIAATGSSSKGAYGRHATVEDRDHADDHDRDYTREVGRYYAQGHGRRRVNSGLK